MKYSFTNNLSQLVYTIISLTFLAFIRAEERVISEEFKALTFSENQVVGWNSKSIKRCEATTIYDFSSGNLFGIFAKETPNLQKMFNNLPPHWSLSVRFDVLLFRSVDNEKVNIVLDGANVATYSKGKADGFDICDTSYWFNDQLYFFQKNITHSNPSLNFQITSNFDQDNDDEGFGIKNFSLRIDTCHNTCASCSGPHQNQCTSCPSKSVLTNGTCKCTGMTIAHEYACLNECPYGFKPDSTNTFCTESYCNPAKCSKCEDKTQLCTECRDGYLLFRKACIRSCPSFAPQNGKQCQDPSLTTPNGRYLLQGLSSNSFGESEIAGLGLQLSGFNQVTFGNCGSVQLLGGPFIGQQGSTIKRIFQDIKPHYQIRFGFQFYQIDSWDDEGFRVTVDKNVVDVIKKNVLGGTQNLCGSNSWKDSTNMYSKTMDHTSPTLEFEMNLIFDEAPFNESFGMRDLYFIVDYCGNGCKSCDKDKCMNCIEGFQLSGNKCVDSCGEDEYIYNKTCQKCDSVCKSCKGTATTCTSCKDGTFLMDTQCVSKCPENYYNNSKLHICSQCLQGDCPICVPPGYSSSCKNCNGLKIISNKCA